MSGLVILAKIQRIGDLEIDQDLSFQQREWSVQRAGWVVMLLIVLAAIAGFFGALGPLANAVASAEEDLLQAHYGWFERFKAPATLRIQLDARAVTGSEVRIWIDRAYLGSLLIEQISPQPKSTQAGADRLLYTFEASAEVPKNMVIPCPVRKLDLIVRKHRVGFGRERHNDDLPHGRRP